MSTPTIPYKGTSPYTRKMSHPNEPDQDSDLVHYRDARDRADRLAFFMAHAPVEPQDWFEPTMPLPPTRPAVPQAPRASSGERTYADNLFRSWDGNRVGDIARSPKFEDEELAAWVADLFAFFELDSEWNRECGKQRFIQWPLAWATAQIKLLEKTCGN